MNIKYRRDLYQAIRVPGFGAEIGVAEGNFSEDMLRWPINFPTFYLVDRWCCVRGQRGDGSMPQEWHDANFAKVCERIKPFGDRAVILRGSSSSVVSDVKDHTLSLLYIDGDHSYQGVVTDLQCWVPKVVPGGIVGLHDFLNESYGVKKAVTEFCQTNGYDLHVIPEDKEEDAGAWFCVDC